MSAATAANPNAAAAATATATNDSAANAAATTSQKCAEKVLDDNDSTMKQLFEKIAALEAQLEDQLAAKSPTIVKLTQKEEEKKATELLSWADSDSTDGDATASAPASPKIVEIPKDATATATTTAEPNATATATATADADAWEFVEPKVSKGPKECVLVENPNGTSRPIHPKELVMLPADCVSVWLRAIRAIGEARNGLREAGVKVNSTVKEVIVPLGTNFKRPEEGVMLILRMDRDAVKALLQFCQEMGFRPVSADCLCPVDADGKKVPLISVKNPKGSRSASASASASSSSSGSSSASAASSSDRRPKGRFVHWKLALEVARERFPERGVKKATFFRSSDPSEEHHWLLQMGDGPTRKVAQSVMETWVQEYEEDSD